jgi:hypothetical protein
MKVEKYGPVTRYIPESPEDVEKLRAMELDEDDVLDRTPQDGDEDEEEDDDENAG